MRFQKLFLSILSGVLLWLAWPTYGFAVLLFVAIVPLLWMEQSIRKECYGKSNFKVWSIAYVGLLIWNVATTYWLINSTVFGFLFANLVNTALMATVFLGYHIIAKRTTQGAALTFLACLWMCFEWLHLHWEFSWPWLNLGNGFSEYTSWIQWYEYTGTFGGTLWVWIVNIAIFKGLIVIKQTVNKERRQQFFFKYGIISLALILLPIIASFIIESHTRNLSEDSQTAEVLILQPNIEPYQEKYTLTNNQIAAKLVQLASQNISDRTRLIVAPETVLADHIIMDDLDIDESIQTLRKFLYNYQGTSLMGGISLLEVFSDEKRKTKQSNFDPTSLLYFNDYNSAFLLGTSKEIELYHKSKLVVGVENFPYKSVLEPVIGNAMISMGGASYTKTTQKERGVFNLQPIIAAPIICYESVYGSYLNGYDSQEANLFTIITNDAWWGNTQGHKQHLSIARLRAIEYRKYVARSANTGISAIINHYGDIEQQLDYDTVGSIKGTVRLKDQRTFYSRNGDYISRIAAFGALFIILFSSLRRGKTKRK
ncbi:MAG: apolipoprotein N-acyltransferase [Nonlabens sp.]